MTTKPGMSNVKSMGVEVARSTTGFKTDMRAELAGGGRW